MSDENSLVQPFAPLAGTFDEDCFLTGGGVIMGGTTEVTGVGIKPCVIFKFAIPDGSGFFPPTIFVLDPDKAHELPTLVADAVDAAMEAVAHLTLTVPDESMPPA